MGQYLKLRARRPQEKVRSPDSQLNKHQSKQGFKSADDMSNDEAIHMNIGISDKGREESVELLHKTLANQHVLYQRLRNYHWNFKGKHFLELHAFFEEFYNEVVEDIDEIAERIQSLGHNTKATMTEYVELSDLKEFPETFPDEEGMVEQLVKDNETMIRRLRQDSAAIAEHDDTGTEDMLIGLMKKHEKRTWMLRSFLGE